MLKRLEPSDMPHLSHRITFSESPLLNVTFLLPPVCELQVFHSASFRKEVFSGGLLGERKVGKTEREKAEKGEGREGAGRREGDTNIPLGK